MKKVVLAGGTGFIGSFLEERFLKEGYHVVVISRQKGHVQWSDASQIAQALEGATLLVNLAGKSVDCRYNEKNKKEILNSRVETTRILGELISTCKNPPALWINSSTATIYRHAEDRPMTEDHGEIGNGFSVEVARSWERSFFSFQLPGTRQIALRMAIVLGKDGGVMKPFTNLVRFGLGGKQGHGRQMFSWIHIEDVYGIIQFLQAHTELRGVFNCCAPNPVRNEKLMKALRKVMHVPIGFPSPAWLLKMGAVIINTETELILKSRWVIPERLLTAGYHFQHPNLDLAVEDIIRG